MTPTPLAAILSGEHASKQIQEVCWKHMWAALRIIAYMYQKYLVVETNFASMPRPARSCRFACCRIFLTWSHSTSHISSTDMTSQAVRFPNMYAANVTRDSVRRALLKGITSKEILSFLQVCSWQ